VCYASSAAAFHCWSLKTLAGQVSAIKALQQKETPARGGGRAVLRGREKTGEGRTKEVGEKMGK